MEKYRKTNINLLISLIKNEKIIKENKDISLTLLIFDTKLIKITKEVLYINYISNT